MVQNKNNSIYIHIYFQSHTNRGEQMLFGIIHNIIFYAFIIFQIFEDDFQISSRNVK